MTVVFVHGNPEIAAVWDPLAQALSKLGYDDQIRLSPPAFGGPVPEGFGFSAQDYRTWLITELESIPGPIDLVGHDLGGGWALGAAMARPDLLRTWCVDVLGAFHPDYVWHDWAQTLQASPAGEEWVAAHLALSAQGRADTWISHGMDPAIALQIGAAFDETMGQAILHYYRAVKQPALANAGRFIDQARVKPGLAIVTSEDHVAGTEEQHLDSAQRAGARVAKLEGVGHWWMTQGGGRQGAEALHRFWSSISDETP